MTIGQRWQLLLGISVLGLFALCILEIDVRGIHVRSASAITTSTKTKKSKDEIKPGDYCSTEGSLHSIALQMANYSSPPGSASFNKVLRVLQSSTNYHVYLPHKGIFTNVAKNMGTLLEGFGLKPWDSSRNSSFLLLEISYYAHKAGPEYLICQTIDLNCSTLPRIILQSEQLQKVGEDYFQYLRECHQSPLCAIWDFSDHHYDWAIHHQMDDSVLLLPVMHQSLVGDYKDPPIPLMNRTWDVVFFGSRKDRRLDFFTRVERAHPSWKTTFSFSTDMARIQKAYANSKVCLILHSYSNQSAGEYHRLNELAPSGCIPVVEQFADTLGVEAYENCGGVVFARYELLLSNIHTVLRTIQRNASAVMQRQEQHVQWWKNKIRWAELLHDIFD